MKICIFTSYYTDHAAVSGYHSTKHQLEGTEVPRYPSPPGSRKTYLIGSLLTVTVVDDEDVYGGTCIEPVVGLLAIALLFVS